jgi:1-deoxy-D-xylulose-5-phosphate synthase
MGSDILVILNDNEMFISHRVGALGGYLAKLMTAGMLKEFEKKVELFFKRIHFWGSQILKVAKRFKVLLFPGMLFEEMGFAYLGPVDGHDINRLIQILENVKKLKGPVLLHVITKKGKGYDPAEDEPIKYHGIGKFNIITGEPEPSGSKPTYTQVFSKTLVKLAEKDKTIIAITAAMPEGTGLDLFAKEFGDRLYDVGIAEQHAVTFAAGLACEGMKPVCAIYSTFMQRAFDQIIHDVALQKLPVIFAMDRAGLVGEDGPTHHGTFDLSFTRLIPNLTVMAPSDENELQNMLKTAFTVQGPVAIRYPRGEAQGIEMDKEPKTMPVGKSLVRKQGKDVWLFAIGSTVYPAMKAAQLLEKEGVSAGVVDIRFLKPFDSELLLTLARSTGKVAVVEENSVIGGLTSAVSELLAGKDIQIHKIALPDIFVEQGNVKILRDKYGLSEEKIAKAVSGWLVATKV